MTDLFAAPARRPPQRIAIHIGPGSYCCPCGAREEVETPAPAVLVCFGCKRRTMAPYASLFPVPPGSVRKLTDAERAIVQR